ncbi:uncharacterized protein LOC106155656 [Lingula anatina]|uniref:Uncharacterized protein LOC106155656 n=1 Tax=Lingula anatina TaxID=7574 RepID=A0A1S3HKP8_LINAN|nr:uncharacterized protein LOC106155656 [Lingula anatina]XP_013386042.1 uncharacterized protein LOC106155656 [Lingula anatina]|eukprot:XP_013386041.1 uncharacterized protein LOC106155656 [Lingula anatina]
MSPVADEVWTARPKSREAQIQETYYKRNATTSNVSPLLFCRVTPRRRPAIEYGQAADDSSSIAYQRKEETYARRNASSKGAIIPSKYDAQARTQYLEDDDETPSQVSSRRYAWAPRTKTHGDLKTESFNKRNISTNNISPDLATRDTARQQTSATKDDELVDEIWGTRPHSRDETRKESFDKRNKTTSALDTHSKGSSVLDGVNYSYPADYEIHPRIVKPEAQEIADLSKGGRMSMLLGKGSKHLSQPTDYPIQPRVVKPEAQEIADLSKGKRMEKLLGKGTKRSSRSQPTDYPLHARAVKPEAEEIANLGKGGRMQGYIGKNSQHLSLPQKHPIHPRVVKSEAADIANLSKGGRMNVVLGNDPQQKVPYPNDYPIHPRKVTEEASGIARISKGGRMERLIHEYGHLTPSARPVPRIKPEAEQIYEPHRGKRVARIIKQQRTSQSARSYSSLGYYGSRDDTGDVFGGQRPHTRDETRSESFHRRNATTWW